METPYNSIKKEINKKVPKDKVLDFYQLKNQLWSLNKWIINNIAIENFRTISSTWSKNLSKIKYILSESNIQKPKNIKESSLLIKKLINKSWLIKNQITSDQDYLAALIKIQKDYNLWLDAIFGNQMINSIYDNMIFHKKPIININKLTPIQIKTIKTELSFADSIKTIDIFQSKINIIQNKLWNKNNDPIFSFMSNNAIADIIKNISAKITSNDLQYIYDWLFDSSIYDKIWIQSDIKTLSDNITNNTIIKKYIYDVGFICGENNYNQINDDFIVNWFFQTLKIMLPSIANSLFWQKIESNKDYKLIIFKYFMVNSK